MSAFDWSNFAEVTKDRPQGAVLERAALLFEHPGHALDLGCGGGRDTRYLLAHGWRVTAVDREPYAIKVLAEQPNEQLQAVCSSFEEFKFEREKYDMVSAQFTLPFVPSASFREVFARLKESIKPGGIFTGQFFGVRDEWNKPENDMNFVTREDVDDLLRDMTVIELTEDEHMGSTALGREKYWHVFHIIGRKAA